MHQKRRSTEVYESLCSILPGGVNSPVRSFRNVKMPPMVVQSGLGDTIVDVDGNSYIDFCCSWGSLIHGHAHPEIVAAAQKQMANGSSFGITTEIEGKLAHKIARDVPSIELIRFVSSGTEATMSAARVARGFTNRRILVKFIGNYHGHADSFLVQAGSGVLGLTATSTSSGIPNEFVQFTACLPYNNSEVVKAYLNDPENRDDIAAVIIEPVSGNMGVIPADAAFLQMLREETEKIGALLIFDEVKCGYRMPQKTAQKMYGITPDLSCFAKIIGGGFPTAAFGGRKDVMETLAPLGKVYQAGTLSGNPVAMAAGLTALELLDIPGTYEELLRKVEVIAKPVKELIKAKGLNACLQQCGTMFNLMFGQKVIRSMDEAKLLDLDKFAHFFQYMYGKGIYVSPSQYESWFVSTVHTQEHLEYTRDAILEYLNEQV